MDIIFMGTPDYAERILERLILTDGIDVVAVYTQPDKPVGRKRVMTAPVVKKLALEHAIPVYQPARLRDKDVEDVLSQIDCDFIVVAAYGQILSQAVLDHAPCINLHASILPHYRGASPIQQTLLNGDRETGVTAMLMEIGLDTGPILKTARIPIPEDEMVSSLFDRLTALACDLTVEVLFGFETLEPVPQDDAAATYCKKITKADGEIKLEDALSEYDRFRAFTPWPGVYLSSGLKLKEMTLESSVGEHRPGEILSIEAKSVLIGCATGVLRLYRVQPPSKKEMSVIDYLNGKRSSVDDTLA